MSEAAEEAAETADDDACCAYCKNRSRHPRFVYLIRDSTIPPNLLPSCYCYIGVSRHPFHRLLSQNRVPGWRVGSKATKHAAPNWMMEMIAGPFMTEHHQNANKFKTAWRQKSRRFFRRVKYGLVLARKSGVNMACRDKPFIERVAASAPAQH